MIAIIWQNHRAYFSLVEHVDRKTVFLNFCLLAITVFVPFATNVLGSYHTMRPAAFLYGLTLTLSATCFNLIALHVTASGSLSPQVSAKTIRETFRAYRIAWVTYAIATIVALFVPLLSCALYILIAAYHLIPTGFDRDEARL